MQLRPYQLDAVSGAAQALRKGAKSALVVLPTGSGKSVVIAEIVRRALAKRRGARILVVTHVKELLEQNCKELRGLAPEVQTAYYCAGLNEKRIGQVTFASIQSIYAQTDLLELIDLVLIDEAHLVPATSTTMYRQLLDAIDAPMIGLTATPFRVDSGHLSQGEDAIFEQTAHEVSMADLVEQGYLAPLTAQQGDDVNLISCNVNKQDYVTADLERVYDVDDMVGRHANTIVAKFAERKSWLIFCVSIQHAEDMASALVALGVSAAAISSHDSTEDRDAKIEAFKSGRLRALVNVKILTTGFNHPPLDAIAVVRPTISASLYVQMLGRGSRLAEGKDNCLVLDFGGNVRRFGFVDMVNVKSSRKAREVAKDKQEPLTRACPECDAFVSINKRHCPECGAVLIETDPNANLRKAAHKGAIMSTDAEPTAHAVAYYRFDEYTTRRGKDMIKVLYYGEEDYLIAEEYLDVCGHSAYGRHKAEQWWRLWARGVNLECPISVDDFMVALGMLRRPTAIQVVANGKYDNITGYIFKESKAA